MYNDTLQHHGIKGQKWGVRRYQNEDGSYTSAGAKRYSEAKETYKNAKKEYGKAQREFENRLNYHPISNFTKKGDAIYTEKFNNARDKYNKYRDAKKEYKAAKKDFRNERLNDPQTRSNIKKGAAIVAGTAIVATGAALAIKKYKQSGIKALSGPTLNTIKGDKGNGWREISNLPATISRHEGSRASSNLPAVINRYSGSTKPAVRSTALSTVNELREVKRDRRPLHAAIAGIGVAGAAAHEVTRSRKNKKKKDN